MKHLLILITISLSALYSAKYPALIPEFRTTYEDLIITTGLYSYDYDIPWEDRCEPNSGLYFSIERADTTVFYFELSPNDSAWSVGYPLRKMGSIHSLHIEGTTMVITFGRMNFKPPQTVYHNLINYITCWD
jgi:hypothetical protein